LTAKNSPARRPEEESRVESPEARAEAEQVESRAEAEEVEGPESSVECVLEGIEGVESGGRGSPGLEEDADSRVEGVLGAGLWTLDTTWL
jgi:hypothetical protein